MCNGDAVIPSWNRIVTLIFVLYSTSKYHWVDKLGRTSTYLQTNTISVQLDLFIILLILVWCIQFTVNNINYFVDKILYNKPYYFMYEYVYYSTVHEYSIKLRVMKTDGRCWREFMAIHKYSTVLRKSRCYCMLIHLLVLIHPEIVYIQLYLYCRYSVVRFFCCLRLLLRQIWIDCAI